MATQDSTPSRQVRSTTTPTGEESVTPVSQPSSLGELSASMFTESNRKLEVIQRAQVGSLMGADRNKESQEKTPKRQSPALATRPKKYALELWVEIETSEGVYTTPNEDSYSVDFAIDTINRAYPGCTGMYLGMAGHMLAFYGKKTNPRAGLLHGQGVAASKAIANIPTWMGYFARWRVRCVSISEASEILAGYKRLEKENLRRICWELQNWFFSMWLDPTLSAAARPFQPQAAPLSSERMMCPKPTLLDTDWQGVVLRWVLLLAHLWEGHLSVTVNPLTMMGYPLILPSQIGPSAGGVGAEGVKVAGVVVTLMELTPLGGGIRKRMDFPVRSKSPNLGARRVILMMWPTPLGSGPAVSPTIMIIMRILISCPW